MDILIKIIPNRQKIQKTNEADNTNSNEDEAER